MKRKLATGSLIKLIFIYIYAFYIIYTPSLGFPLNVPSQVLVTILLLVVLFFYLPKRIQRFNEGYVNKHVFYLVLGIFISSIYFACRALASMDALSLIDTRLVQNNFIIVQTFHIVIIISILRSMGYKSDDLLKFILNIGLIQSLICIFMILIPSFREVALTLYYNGGEENVFISSSRIYGISSDYTFGTPIFHGMLGSVACIYALIKKNYKFLIYVPFLVIAILLNGRTGLVILLLCTILGYSLLLIRGKSVSKVIISSILFLTIIFVSLFLIKDISPNTYNWIEGGFESTINLVFNKELEGNYKALFDNMLYWPEGAGILFGEGHRVFGQKGIELGFTPSDIGYVNDMFMGGIIYISILYFTIFKFLLKKLKGTSSEALFNNIISVMLVFTLLISNYKGESMKGGIILLGVIFIKLILMEGRITDTNKVKTVTK